VGARRAKAAVALGAFVAMLPARWAAAEEPVAPVPPAAAQATDDETPARTPRRQRRSSVDPEARPGTPPRLVVDPLTLEGASFYEAIGRPDLASEYRTRHALRIGSRVVGGLSLGLGALAWVAMRALEAGATAPICGIQIVAGGDGAACSPPDDTLWVPDLMMAGGLALLIAPVFWSNDPVSDAEKEELARDVSARARTERAVMWSFAPAPGGQGGTLSLSGRF
jgi:hypothetical protein